MKRRKKGLFIIFILLLLAVLNVKSIGRRFYPLQYTKYIQVYAEQYNLDPYLVAAVIRTESNFQPKAQSHKDALGLMQIMPETAVWAAEKMGIQGFQLEQLYNPEFNIAMGCWYLDNLRKEFPQNIELVIAAYNGGPGNVQKWLRQKETSEDGKSLKYIPFKETDQYVKKVKVNYHIYKKLYNKKL